MYGLPNNADLSFLLGREIIQICFGLYQLQFRFDQNIGISVEGLLRYERIGGKILDWSQGKHVQAASLVDLLSAKVVELAASQDGTLRLQFSDGSVLTIFDDKKQYESYQIWCGSQLIVV